MKIDENVEPLDWGKNRQKPQFPIKINGIKDNKRPHIFVRRLYGFYNGHNNTYCRQAVIEPVRKKCLHTVKRTIFLAL